MKPLTPADYINGLISQGEHQQQDFKFEISDTRKIARTLSAFANTEGGRLLIGVKDNGKIAGVHSEEEIYMIEAAARMYCSPPAEFTIETYVVENRQVLVANIPQSKNKPVYAKDESGKLLAYVRVNDENVLATPVHLRIWQQNAQSSGELITFTDAERTLLKLLEGEESLSLNRYSRKTGISRRASEHLLAKFIRYGIVELVFENHKFYYKLKE